VPLKRASISLALIVGKYWKQYIAWKEGKVRRAVFVQVRRMLSCRTPRLGLTLYRCESCDTVRVVPHSCKSVACPSCGKVRTDAWCKELLSDILDVPYRHLVFTLPWQLRLPIYDNRERLLAVLFRAAADAVLSLTVGNPAPLGKKSQQWLAGRNKSRRRRRGRGRKRRPFVPGMIAVLHTFGNDLKWNPHIHMVVTAGGLSLDGKRWVPGPKRYLVPAPLLGTEWKLRVIEGIRRLHQQERLVCRRLRSDHRRRVDIDKLLGHVRKQTWRILIGPSLRTAGQAVRYACRYSKRPVIAEWRLLNFRNGYVTFRFKDHHRGGAVGIKTLPVLRFMDKVFQHLPDAHFRNVRQYGLFSTRRRSTLLPTARQLLAQRKRRRPSPTTWEQRRKTAGEKRPLSCPRCGREMMLWLLVFGKPELLARILKLESSMERVPPGTIVVAAAFKKVAVTKIPIKKVAA
jgi:hypothetical protein